MQGDKSIFYECDIMQTGFLERPALLVGVTGHIDLMRLPSEDQQQIRDSVKRVLSGFRQPVSASVGPHSSAARPVPKLCVSEQVISFGIQQTPITILTAFAPGADTLVADVAEELQRELDEDRRRRPDCSGSTDGREDAYRVI